MGLPVALVGQDGTYTEPINLTDIVDLFDKTMLARMQSISANRVVQVDAKGNPIYPVGPLQQLRASKVLTTSYVASTAIDVSNANQLVILMDFTLGSLTDALVKVEQADYGDSGQGWYPQTIKNTGAVVSDEYQSQLLTDVSKLIPSTANLTRYLLNVPIKGRWARISVMGEGTVTSSLFAAWAYAGIS
jgi:hypothetical protein